MLPRTLEPEVMDTPEEAVDYDAMDHNTVNRVFVDDLLVFLRKQGREGNQPPRILDVGTGTAQIPLELCTRGLTVRVTAIDLAGHMLQLALRNVLKACQQESIKLEQVDAKELPYVDGQFDVVMSNSIIHHIPEPLSVLREMSRVLKSGGALFIRDLLRPDNAGTLDHLVVTYAGDGNAHQQKMFRDSLHAALRLDEVRGLLHQVGLPSGWVSQTSDRHWTIAGQQS